MKALVGAFNQEKALVGAFSVITNLRMELFEALADRGRGEAAGKKESVSLDDISSSQAAAKREAAPGARRKELRFDSVVHDVESDALRIVSERIAREPHGANTATWRLLEEEISDVKLLMETCTERRRGRGSRLELLTF